MLARIKPYLIVILALPLCLGETGYWLYANIYQHLLNEEMSEVLREISPDDKQLVIVRMPLMQEPNRGLTWTKADKEFLLDGEMYDIVKATISSDSVAYACYRDTEENSYRIRLVNRANQEQGTSPGITLPVLGLSFSYLPAIFVYQYVPHGESSFPPVPRSVADPLIETLSPPPRLNFC